MKKVKRNEDVFQFTKLELGMELILLRPALDGLSRKHQRRARLIIDELKLGIQDAESFFPVRGKVHWQQARKALWHLVEGNSGLFKARRSHRWPIQIRQGVRESHQ